MKKITAFLLLFCLLLSGCAQTELPEEPAPSQAVTDFLTVHIIDVGQADSILLQADDKTMLIDAGNNNDGDDVVAYIKDCGITYLDYVIGTHPHADHIGGMDDVIESIPIGEIYLPNATANTKTFEDVLLAMESKEYSYQEAVAGETIDFADSATLLSPQPHSYDDTNNYSAVLRVTYGERSFLFTGDAEEYAEAEILKSGQELRADVLKVGHHGSSTSTTDAFLRAVSPSYAVISCGEGNSYGHPHREIVQKLADIETYRTDTDGTIIFTTDGTSITVQTERGN